jgi:hypothetical protein
LKTAPWIFSVGALLAAPAFAARAEQTNEVNWCKHRNRFTTIAPKGWEDCVLLQPADLIAYENFKIIERNHASQQRRRIVELLLDLNSVGGRGVELTRQWMKEINEKQTDESRRDLYKNARIWQPQKQKH